MPDSSCYPSCVFSDNAHPFMGVQACLSIGIVKKYALLALLGMAGQEG